MNERLLRSGVTRRFAFCLVSGIAPSAKNLPRSYARTVYPYTGGAGAQDAEENCSPV
jgi:hypothetical protein